MNEATKNACGCNPCRGIGCTCGCQAAAAPAAPPGVATGRERGAAARGGFDGPRVRDEEEGRRGAGDGGRFDADDRLNLISLSSPVV